MNWQAACVDVPLTESMTAVIAAAVAALGTLAAKHRPAGKRTRATDRATGAGAGRADEELAGEPFDDWELDAYGAELAEQELEPGLGWRPPGRIRAAARALRGR